MEITPDIIDLLYTTARSRLLGCAKSYGIRLSEDTVEEGAQSLVTYFVDHGYLDRYRGEGAMVTNRKGEEKPVAKLSTYIFGQMSLLARNLFNPERSSYLLNRDYSLDYTQEVNPNYEPRHDGGVQPEQILERQDLNQALRMVYARLEDDYPEFAQLFVTLLEVATEPRPVLKLAKHAPEPSPEERQRAEARLWHQKLAKLLHTSADEVERQLIALQSLPLMQDFRMALVA